MKCIAENGDRDGGVNFEMMDAGNKPHSRLDHVCQERPTFVIQCFLRVAVWTCTGELGDPW